MNKHKEALKKIVEVTLAQSTANKIATEALQSESEQPKSESMMYSEDEVIGFGIWLGEKYWFNLSTYKWECRNEEGLYEVLDSKQLMELYRQSLQPKTEEDTYRRICKEHDWVKLGEDKRQCTICGGIQEQPTSPSIEKMAELKKEFLYERHYYSSKERLWEFIEQVFEEGYKANNSLDELDKWVREERYHYGNDINAQELMNKLYQLKTKP